MIFALPIIGKVVGTSGKVTKTLSGIDRVMFYARIFLILASVLVVFVLVVWGVPFLVAKIRGKR